MTCHSAMLYFVKKSYIRRIDAKDIELFLNGSVHKFYCLKALITLEQVITSMKTLMVRL